MHIDLLNRLACPLCAGYPLGRLSPKDTREEMDEGFIICPTCAVAYPVLNGIPHLVRGGLRRSDRDFPLYLWRREDLTRWAEANGMECVPGLPSGKPDAMDRNLMAEGDYWARYLDANVSRGDRSILDCRCPGEHRPYLHGGVMERDDRDVGRSELGIWPARLSRALRRWWAERLASPPSTDPAGGAPWVLDVGCGGGQFGLEPAYLGMRVVGLDLSLGSLEIAQAHARSVALEEGGRLSDRVDYIYADPCQPPFRPGAFDLMMGKDSLHHIPDARAALKTLERLLAPDGRVIFYEHIGESRVFARLRRLALSRLLPRIQRLHENERVEIPSVFYEGSVHEDMGRDAVLDALRETFDIRESIGEMYLYFEIERLVYFAFGRRPWLSRPAGWLTRLMEDIYCRFRQPDHILVWGRTRR